MNQRSGPPAPTERLAFRQMRSEDLNDMAALLGDPGMMRYYPRPKTRDEARAWIDWNRRLYREEGFGLWLVTLRSTGEFAGDCGLTPQAYDGVVDVEVGYHIRAGLQGLGYATEAAAACRDYARDVLAVKRLVALIHPANVPSQRVAEKIGLAAERDTVGRNGAPIRVYAASLLCRTASARSSRHVRVPTRPGWPATEAEHPPTNAGNGPLPPRTLCR